MTQLPLLTKRQVASVLAVSGKTVDNYCAAGKLSYIRIPAGKRFDQLELERFLASRKSVSHHEEA